MERQVRYSPLLGSPWSLATCAAEASLQSVHTLLHVKWDKRVGEEADLGVGFGPCRFQRAAGLCVSEEKIGGRGLRRWRCVWGLGPGRGHVGCSSVLTGGRAPGWGQGAAVGSERTRGFRVSQKAKCCSLWCPLPQTGPRVELANG